MNDKKTFEFERPVYSRPPFENADDAWCAFYERLEAVKTLREARALSDQTPPPDTPGREFYSNLGVFLMEFIAPGGACMAELWEYHRLLQAWESDGTVKPGTCERFVPGLEKAFSQLVKRAAGG